jgi:HAD superfamily hydrolase (TIGR01509 family)
MSYLKAVIFGAIDTIAETSNFQRQAFNAAFDQADLDWNWNYATYTRLLNIHGGQNQLRAYRNACPSRSQVNDAMLVQLHADKVQFAAMIFSSVQLQPRPGVADLITACQYDGIKVAWCTCTSIDHVDGVMTGLRGSLPLSQLDTVITIDNITRPKPAPDAYLACLEQLHLRAGEVVAIEDTPTCIAAAKAAGIVTVATPSAMALDQDCTEADWVVPSLQDVTVERLSELLRSARHISESKFRSSTDSPASHLANHFSLENVQTAKEAVYSPS